MASLTAADLNYIIFRYFCESGFSHSAFTLRCEAGVDVSAIDGNLVPPGALVKVVQKGLQYIEREAMMNKEKDNMEEEFVKFLTPMELLTKDVNEMQKLVAERKSNQQLGGALNLGIKNEGASSSKVKDKERKDQEKPDRQGFNKLRKGPKRK